MVDQKRVVTLFAVLLLLFHVTFEQSLVAPLTSWNERLALIQLRSSLGLRSKEWPIKADPCRLWVGVQCQNGSVFGINISGFRRTRIGSQKPRFSVDALSNLTQLASFNASRFSLPGSIPDWFGQRLISLQVLDLRSCSIGDVIPSTLGNLTNLTTLYLSDNGLTGSLPSSLGQLSWLSVLDLSRNSLTGSIPSFFASLRNLTLLDMSSNFLSEAIPSAIGTLPNLQFLNLSGNNLSSFVPTQLGNLSSLVDLDLSFNSLSGSIPPDWGGLRNLKRLIIGNNSFSGPLPVNLFPPSAKLQFIVLSYNDFTGNLPIMLWSMPQLQFLDVSGNNFGGTLPDLGSNSSTIDAVFNLSNNIFYGNLTNMISRINFIDLSGNYLQGIVPDYSHTNASLERNCLRNVTHQRTVAQCSSFYANRGLIFDNFGLPNATQPPASSSNKKHRRTKIILAGVLGGIGLIALVSIIIVLLIACFLKRSSATQRCTGVGPVPAVVSPPSPGVTLKFSSLGETYTYQQILQVTNDLSDGNLLKSGHSGDLFRGILEGGIPVVIKRIDLHSVKKESYILELDFFSKISHPRFVPLMAHCLENNKAKFLIYKHMPNGDLSSSLFRKGSSDDDKLQSLDWITRLKIAIGAAEALSYLHHECSPPLVHRDVKASSILLDDKFEVRLGSLSEVCVQEEDIQQSRITRLLRLPQTSEQGASATSTTCTYDVYCFGKVLLELVTGKVGMSASSDAILKDWLEGTLPYISIYDKELVTNIIDPTLIIDEDLLEEVWAMAIVARSCLNPRSSRRPLMRYILKALENPLKVVREENSGSARLRATSSRSWNATLFGSWRQNSSDVVVPAVPTSKAGGGSSFKQSGTSGSQGSGQNGEGHSSSNRRQSKEIFPEPLDKQDVERLNEG